MSSRILRAVQGSMPWRDRAISGISSDGWSSSISRAAEKADLADQLRADQADLARSSARIDDARRRAAATSALLARQRREADSLDCSGLMLYAWAASGRSLPHSSRSQFAGTKRVSVSAIRPGIWCSSDIPSTTSGCTSETARWWRPRGVANRSRSAQFSAATWSGSVESETGSPSTWTESRATLSDVSCDTL